MISSSFSTASQRARDVSIGVTRRDSAPWMATSTPGTAIVRITTALIASMSVNAFRRLMCRLRWSWRERDVPCPATDGDGVGPGQHDSAVRGEGGLGLVERSADPVEADGGV